MQTLNKKRRLIGHKNLPKMRSSKSSRDQRLFCNAIFTRKIKQDNFDSNREKNLQDI